MTVTEITALLLFCTAMSFSPGPNTTLSTALAANGGLRTALRFCLAVPAGWTLLMIASGLGLGALVLGRKLAGFTQPREHVGVLLPNVQALAVTLFGLSAFGRVPALLNFTAGVKNLRAAGELAELIEKNGGEVKLKQVAEIAVPPYGGSLGYRYAQPMKEEEGQAMRSSEPGL